MTGWGEMDTLSRDGRFVQTTLDASRKSAKSGRETDYRVVDTPEGYRFVSTRFGDENAMVADMDMLRETAKNQRLVYHGHFHPHDPFASPSNQDFDFFDRYSGKDTPVFGVLIGDGKECIGTAIKRGRPADYVERGIAIARQTANSFLKEVLGLNTEGFTGTAHRRYEHAVKRRAEAGDSYSNLVPNAINETGIYEGARFRVKRDIEDGCA